MSDCWRCESGGHECIGCGRYLKHPGGGCGVPPCVSAERPVTCRRDANDPEFCATHEDGMFDVGEHECDTAGGYDGLPRKPSERES